MEKFCLGVRQLQHMLERLQLDWSSLGGQANAIIVKAKIRRIGRQLDDLRRLGDQLTGQLVDNRIEVIDALKLVQLDIDDCKRKLAETESQLQSAQQHLEQADRDLAAAQAELNGEKGFWNGVLTGITFGIYNPLKDNIDKANAAVATHDAERRAIASRRDDLNRYGAELNNGQALLQTLISLDATFSDYQNSANSAQTSLAEADENEERAAAAQAEGAAKYYYGRVGKHMEALIQWIGIFKSAIHG